MRRQLHTRHRGRPNRLARKRARAVWEPAPSGGRSTTLFTRRLDPWRAEIWELGQEVMRLTALVEAETPRAAAALTMLGRMPLVEARDDLAEAATRYLWLLDKGRKIPAGLPPDRHLGDIGYEQGRAFIAEMLRAGRKIQEDRRITLGAVALVRSGSQPWLLPPPEAMSQRGRAPRGPNGRPIPQNPAMRRKL